MQYFVCVFVTQFFFCAAIYFLGGAFEYFEAASNRLIVQSFLRKMPTLGRFSKGTALLSEDVEQLRDKLTRTAEDDTAHRLAIASQRALKVRS
jgi:hypothetical protein